jgi:hypothetical protein
MLHVLIFIYFFACYAIYLCRVQVAPLLTASGECLGLFVPCNSDKLTQRMRNVRTKAAAERIAQNTFAQHSTPINEKKLEKAKKALQKAQAQQAVQRPNLKWVVRSSGASFPQLPSGDHGWPIDSFLLLFGHPDTAAAAATGQTTDVVTLKAWSSLSSFQTGRFVVHPTLFALQSGEWSEVHSGGVRGSFGRCASGWQKTCDCATVPQLSLVAAAGGQLPADQVSRKRKPEAADTEDTETDDSETEYAEAEQEPADNMPLPLSSLAAAAASLNPSRVNPPQPKKARRIGAA